MRVIENAEVGIINGRMKLKREHRQVLNNLLYFIEEIFLYCKWFNSKRNVHTVNLANNLIIHKIEYLVTFLLFLILLYSTFNIYINHQFNTIYSRVLWRKKESSQTDARINILVALATITCHNRVQLRVHRF